MLLSAWRTWAMKSGAICPCVSQPITPPVTTSLPSAAMPFAYPFGIGQPLGFSTNGPDDELAVFESGTTLSVGTLGVVTGKSPQLRYYSAAMPEDAGLFAAICRSAKRRNLPVSVFGSCATNSTARGYL